MKIAQKIETDLGSRIEIASVLLIFVVIVTHRDLVLMTFGLVLFFIVIWFWWSFKKRIILRDDSVEIQKFYPLKKKITTIQYNDIVEVSFHFVTRGPNIFKMQYRNDFGQNEIMSIGMNHSFPRFFLKKLKNNGVTMYILPQGKAVGVSSSLEDQ